MDYVNFYVSIPMDVYLELDFRVKKLKITRNEFIMNTIIGYLSSDSNGFGGTKNAGFYTLYN